MVNVLANVLAIPRYGAAAAAWSTLGTEVVVMGCIAIVVRRRLDLSIPAGRTLRCAGAVAVTAAAVWAVRLAPLAIGFAVAAIVYPPCLLASRAVSVSELRALLLRRSAANA